MFAKAKVAQRWEVWWAGAAGGGVAVAVEGMAVEVCKGAGKVVGVGVRKVWCAQNPNAIRNCKLHIKCQNVQCKSGVGVGGMGGVEPAAKREGMESYASKGAPQGWAAAG